MSAVENVRSSKANFVLELKEKDSVIKGCWDETCADGDGFRN